VADAATYATEGRSRRASVGSFLDRNSRWLFIAPAILLILVVTLYPLGYSIWVSFVNYDFQIPGHAWVGLDNFKTVVEDPIARLALLHTAVIAGAAVALETVLGLGLALAMLRPFRGRRILMTIFVLPLFMSSVVVGQFWNLLLTRPFGPVDYLLGKIVGHDVAISWITDRPWNYIAIVLADAWQWTPFMFVILLAGLTSISDDLYEAAELDGARPRQTFFFVTMPLLVPVLLLAVTFRLLDAVKIFDVVFVLTGGGPGTDTYTASYYLYQEGFQLFHLGQGTAGSWLFLIIIAIVATLLVRRLVRPLAAPSS